MNTKILYILVSSENDTYLESALISIYSTRYRMPDAHIILIVDDLTDKRFTGLRSEILQYVSEKIVVSFEEKTNNMIRSRMLKTNMRSYIKGDFLYLDCDTLVAASLEEMDYWTYDIAAVLDGHVPLLNHPVKEIFFEQGKIFDYPIGKIQNYFSGGVMYVKDTEIAHHFFSMWHQNYLFGLRESVHHDEPALAKSNYTMGEIIQELPGEWNCQLRLGVIFLKNLKVLHFWSKRNMPLSHLASSEFLLKIKNEGINDLRTKESIINYNDAFYKPMGLVTEGDLYFNFSPLYEEVRRLYLSEGVIPFSRGAKILELIYEKGNKNKLEVFFMKMNNVIYGCQMKVMKFVENINIKK